MHVTRTGAAFECETLGEDRASLRRSLSNRLVYSIGKDPITATTRDWFNTAACAVRERLIEHWMETMRSYYRSDAKRVYSYAACQEQGDALYGDLDEWTRRAILNIAGMGRFSSDRAVLEYARNIWAVNPVRH